MLPWLETRKTALANRWLVREQAFGEALNPDKLERLGRYEVHLDRKLERMLSMLLRLQGPAAGGRQRGDPFGKMVRFCQRVSGAAVTSPTATPLKCVNWGGVPTPIGIASDWCS